MSRSTTAMEEEILLRSDSEEEVEMADEFCFVRASTPTPPTRSEVVSELDDSIEVIQLSPPPPPESHSPGPQEEGESMSVDMDTDRDSPPLRRPHQRPSTRSSPARDDDELWAYRPLEPYMEAISAAIDDEPALLGALQTSYRRLVQLIRSRPCGSPNCPGKVSMPVRPAATTSRNAVIREVPPSVEVGTMTPRASTSTTETQTRQTTQRSVTTQTTEEYPQTNGQNALSRGISGAIGWRVIGGKEIYVTPPKPGCWNCGRTNHRAPSCLVRTDFKYCFKCGLGNVTLKECPIHAREWRAQGPYVRSLGVNVPRHEKMGAERRPSGDRQRRPAEEEAEKKEGWDKLPKKGKRGAG